jgi:REP element-mobilizing transposase RayT
MPREKRLDNSGYYHISNRGVGLREVFLSHEDRIFFITLLCTCAKQYDFQIHSYALISNGYNLLIKTNKNNLSHIMKLINGQYTSYFNRRYHRAGHLWEGRFKSWYLPDEGFVLEILAYIEYLPVATGLSVEKQNYIYASYRQFIGIDERLPCLLHSIVFRKFNTLQEIKNFFNKPIDVERINSIHRFLKKSNNKEKKTPKKTLSTLTEKDFNFDSIQDRNKKIYQIYHEGYSQAQIGTILGISQQAVYKIIKKVSSA